MEEVDDLTFRQASRKVDGVSFPALIRNGSYFLTDINVFADGIVDCWGGVDLPLFHKKVAHGWVQTSIPDGATMSEHNFAHMTVSKAHWKMTPESLINRVQNIVKALNPNMVNLFDMEGDENDRSGMVATTKVGLTGNSTWRKNEKMPFVRPVRGISKRAFWRLDDTVNVVSISLFDDNIVRIVGAGPVQELTFDALRKNKRLCVASKGDRIVIAGLCDFTLSDIEFTVPRDDFLAELEIERDRNSGKETLISNTIEAFNAYKQNPTKETQEALREAYEAVPAHMRRFCGDMDVKDIPIRIALYGEQEIENWSHYAVAKANGERLPRIRVPKLKER